MTARQQPRPQTKGQRASFLRSSRDAARLAAQERELYAWSVWNSEAALAALAASLVITVILRGVENVLPPRAFAAEDPMHLHETRRPTSWTERVNRTTLVVIKCAGPYHVWAESLAERYHFWDLLLGMPDARLVTQVVRLSWADEAISLSHYPDVLWWQGNDRALVDVTSGRRLSAVQTLAWELTARLCDDLGWRYQVRTPMGAQRAKNLGAIDCCTDVSRATVDLAQRIAAEMPEHASLWRIVRVYQDGPASPLHAVLHLVANGVLFCDLDSPITASTWLSKSPRTTTNCRSWSLEAIGCQT